MHRRMARAKKKVDPFEFRGSDDESDDEDKLSAKRKRSNSGNSTPHSVNGWMMVAGLHAETRMVAGQRAVPNFVFLAATIRATRRPVGLEVQRRETREMTRRAS